MRSNIGIASSRYSGNRALADVVAAREFGKRGTLHPSPSGLGLRSCYLARATYFAHPLERDLCALVEPPYSKRVCRGRAGSPVRRTPLVHSSDLDDLAHDLQFEAAVFGIGVDFLDIFAEPAFLVFEPLDELDRRFELRARDAPDIRHDPHSPCCCRPPTVAAR